MTVYPFILRGITLAGIESGYYPLARREVLWKKLAGPWKLPQLESLATVVPLEGLPEKIEAILAGQITGHVAVML